MTTRTFVKDSKWEDDSSQYPELHTNYDPAFYTTVDESFDVDVSMGNLCTLQEETTLEDGIVARLEMKRFWGSARKFHCSCIHLQDCEGPKPRHVFPSNVIDNDRDVLGMDIVLHYNDGKSRLEKTPIVVVGLDDASVHKTIINSYKILKILRWKLIERCHFAISGWKCALRQFLIHNDSVSEEYQWDGVRLRLRYQDHFVQLAAMMFLVSNQLMRMNGYRPGGDVDDKLFLCELNKWLGKEDWEEYFNSIPYHPFANLDDTNRTPSQEEVFQVVSYLEEKLVPDVQLMFDELIDGFKDLKDGLSEIRSSHEIEERVGTVTVTPVMTQYFTRTSEWTWHLTKAKLVEIAVMVAASGNTLMMLAHDENFENNGWKCSCESSTTDEDDSWFITHNRCTCDVCGNKHCVCNNCGSDSRSDSGNDSGSRSDEELV